MGCKSKNVIRWGFQNKKQRFKCRNCGLLFCRKNTSVKRNNRFVWFRKWVLERATIEQLSKESGYSVRTLKTMFDEYLSRPPVLSIYPSKSLNLLIDGTYFSNDICLIVYRAYPQKITQFYRLSDGEYYTEIKEDLTNLLLLGVQIQSITCDGHRAILKAIRVVCPEIIVQRCLVHIQRECRIWLTSHPKNLSALALLKIVHQLSEIRTHQQQQQWIKLLFDWHQEHQNFINEKSFSPATKRFWFKHKMLRRAFVLIKNALPNMFQFLFNDAVPKSTNGLESFFGHLKSYLLLHRGLTKTHRQNFIQWYLYFKNKSE